MGTDAKLARDTLFSCSNRSQGAQGPFIYWLDRLALSAAELGGGASAAVAMATKNKARFHCPLQVIKEALPLHSLELAALL